MRPLSEPTSSAPSSARLEAVKITASLLSRRGSLTSLLATRISSTLSSADQGFIKALCYATFRHIFPLRFILKQLLRKPLKAADIELEAILLIGLCQLFYMPNIPPHAVVSTAVSLCRTIRKEWATGLVNAVLRNAQREHDSLLGKCEQNDEASTGFPAWLLSRLKKEWPDHWKELVAAAQHQPPMTLRLNLNQTSKQEYLAELTAAGLSGQTFDWSPTALQLSAPTNPENLPGFLTGKVSVQDAGAQFAATLLDAQPGMRVLDACSAPGGKTGHLLEITPKLGLFAIDNDARRLARVEQNIRRLGQSAQLRQADATQPELWWDQHQFDCILLDAPCSGTGVLRRHPDILWLRTPAEINTLAILQQRMLTALWPLLKPGGILVYATCSILAQENQSMIAQWIQSTKYVQPCKIELGVGQPRGDGWQILPDSQTHTDGFFYSKLCKTK